MSNELPRLRLLPASPAGRLHATYIADSHVLLFENLLGVEGVHVVNIDNHLIIDAQENGRIVAVEVLYEKGQWAVLPDMTKPSSEVPNDLALRNEWLRVDWVELEVVAETNADRDCVLVRLAKLPASCTWIELSRNCLAAISNDRLVGFFASFA